MRVFALGPLLAAVAALAAAVMTVGAAAAQDAAASVLPDGAREEIGVIIREYLLENPEVIEEAILELQRRHEADQLAEAQAQVREQAAALYDDPRDFTIGPRDAPVTVVEFFDYNCGYCRASAPFVRDLVDSYDGQVRVVFKESPVLGEGSREAARWAIASKATDTYLDAHFALLESGQRLDAQAAAAVLREVGVNLRKIEAKRSAPDTTAQLDDAVELLQTISGGRAATPTFVINDEVVMGADLPRLTALIDRALANGPASER